MFAMRAAVTGIGLVGAHLLEELPRHLGGS